MTRLGFKSTVFHGDSCLGEAEIFPTEKNPSFQFPNNEIRINHFSPPSDRCPPLSILQTISPFAVRCKLESKSPPLNCLHTSCFQELKTAVVVHGDEEVHLVAMQSRQDKIPGFFWCCAVPLGLYGSCKGMLNPRCLAIVFDLDETLIVANTMKSFEDRIEFLQRRIACETDGLRASGMKAELKRYLDDKALLKQYSENDHVNDNGKLIKIQLEEVPPIAGSPEPVIRPIIRLQDRNIVLTRINPEVRDTSVLVRLRPAWEDLRSYLTAKGRKRFEVYVCTMAERDYALEMWRLLDPEANLISSKQLLDRVVCVKSDSRKSLLNVFQDGICHPKMAMVIDDRLKVWDDKDQPRVHVVPPFTPYYAPQAETANAVPVLCVARNVACNVRGGFFKEFDEKLLRRISEFCYEDEVLDLPPAPDVSNYLMTEDTGVMPNGNRDIPVPEGMSGAEAERRMNRPKLGVEASLPFVMNSPDSRSELSQQPLAITSNFITPSVSRTTIPSQRPGLLGASPKEAEASQSELDPIMRRRLLALQHGPDMPGSSLIDPSFRSRPPARMSASPIQLNGGWFVADEDVNAGQLIKRSSGATQESDALQPDKHRTISNPPNHSAETSIPFDKSHPVSGVKAEEACLVDERQRQNQVHPSNSSISEDDEVSLNRPSVNNGELHIEVTPQPSVYIGVLQEIGRRCASKVEFKSVISTSKDLQFSFEVLFSGEKIGVGIGRTRKEAQFQAAKNALRNLASSYVSHLAPDTVAVDRGLDKLSSGNENGFLRDVATPMSVELPMKEELPNASMLEQLGNGDESTRLSVVTSGIKDLCVAGGLSLFFQDQPPVTMTLNNGEFYSQVEIAGEVLGKGIGLSKEGAKLQAAEEALGSLKSMISQQASKRSNSPRSPPTIPNKRSKDELLRGFPALSPSRHQKNGHPIS
ncbi:RNA polymerase II C-terminal domain phosphatase-like 2 isoform X3 [Magnolia sinica]|uniref:RNA polymerase II C-terminal domain phosphatase-like 2 isoform X3 n=1 Tax=Magnolia sinica TaxID=86752 RepID=UPI00265A60B1|nr:RNA polymerase II C-terminal domain phosphatase-like 2 isoform X3 [Magnolia sinica]